MNRLELCHCAAYPAPHPRGLINCKVESLDEPACDACGENCRVTTYDDGIGPYEYWGATGVHTDIRVGSSCCQSSATNPDTGTPAELEENY